MAGLRTLRLSLGALTLDLGDTDGNGFIVTTVDLGFPAVRVVADDLPGQDGSDDQTANFSSRSVQLTGHVFPSALGSRSKGLDALMPFLAPGARPTLTYAFDLDVDERNLDMRVSQWSNPVISPENSAFSVQWVCPNPIAYTADYSEADIPPYAGSTEGRTYPLVYPRHYPTSGGGGSVATTLGTYAAWPTVLFHGPCTDPALFWGTTAIVFSGITIALGDYLEVDARNRTALLNGDPGASRYNFLDFADTNWGPLQPGPNVLRYSPGSFSPPSLAEVRWNDSFLN
jgi:hypothetical protein